MCEETRDRLRKVRGLWVSLQSAHGLWSKQHFQEPGQTDLKWPCLNTHTHTHTRLLNRVIKTRFTKHLHEPRGLLCSCTTCRWLDSTTRLPLPSLAPPPVTFCRCAPKTHWHGWDNRKKGIMGVSQEPVEHFIWNTMECERDDAFFKPNEEVQKNNNNNFPDWLISDTSAPLTKGLEAVCLTCTDTVLSIKNCNIHFYNNTTSFLRSY